MISAITQVNKLSLARWVSLLEKTETNNIQKDWEEILLSRNVESKFEKIQINIGREECMGKV